MANYNQSVLTTAGLALANRAAKGLAKFKITRVTSTADVVGNSDIPELAKLPNEVQVGSITGQQPLADGDETVTGTKVLFTNHNLQTSYKINAVGLYATEDDKSEILYSVITAIEPEFMPDYGDQVLMEFGMTIYVVVGQVENMSIVVNPDSMATVAYVDKAITDHQVVFPETLTYSDKNEAIDGKWQFKSGIVNATGDEYVSKKDAQDYTDGKVASLAKDADVVKKSDGYGAENLVLNSGYPVDTSHWNFANPAGSKKTSLSLIKHDFYHHGKDNLFMLRNFSTDNEIYAVGSDSPVNAGDKVSVQLKGFANVHSKSIDIYLQIKKNDGKILTTPILAREINFSYNRINSYTYSYTMPSGTALVAFRIDNNGVDTEGNSADVYFTEVKVAVEDEPSPWSPAPEDKVNVSDMRKPANDVAGIEEVNAKQDKIGYTPADDADTFHRSPDTGAVTESGNFPGLQVKGVDVATAADLKSIKDSAWRELNFDVSQGNYKAFSAAKIVYKINRDEKYISFFFVGTPSHVGNVANNSTLVTDTTSLVMDLSSVLTEISGINFKTEYGQISDSISHAASLGYAGAKVVFTSQVFISNNLVGVTFLPKDYPDCRIYYTSLVNGI